VANLPAGIFSGPDQADCQGERLRCSYCFDGDIHPRAVGQRENIFLPAGSSRGDNVAGRDVAGLDTDFTSSRQNIGQHHTLLVTDIGRECMKGVVRVWNPDEFRLSAVDEVPENPPCSGPAIFAQAMRVESAPVGRPEHRP